MPGLTPEQASAVGLPSCDCARLWALFEWTERAWDEQQIRRLTGWSERRIREALDTLVHVALVARNTSGAYSRLIF